MIVTPRLRDVLVALSFAVSTSACVAQPKAEFEPQVGQEGKDVVWVPTSQSLVDRMLDLAKVTPRDYVIDLGSGDGRTVITAAKRGARAMGVEYNPDMVALSKRNAAKEGMGEKAVFVNGDIFETDFSQATVITLFLLPDLNVKLRPKILDMKPGTRVVSNSFTMGEWSSDQSVNASESEGCRSYCTAYLWIVPAKVEGKWQTAQGEIEFKQMFQNVAGTVKNGNVFSPVNNGKLRADQITFSAGGSSYSGRVNGNTIEGTVRNAQGVSSKWTATRAGAKPRS